MKYLLLALLLVSCTTPPVTQAPKEPTPSVQVPAGLKTHPKWKPEWTPTLVKALEDHAPGLLSAPIEGTYGNRLQFWVMLFTSLCEYESGFKPETKYEEKFTSHVGGKRVVSRGLFQISLSSANQARYGNKFQSEEELHDPHKNIVGAVKIANFLVMENGVVFGGKAGAWKGMARYWSPFRDAKKAAAIMARVKAAQ